jgi:hypothetical protein
VTTTSPPTTRRPLRSLGAVLLLFVPIARGAAQAPDSVRVHVSVAAEPQCATPEAIAEQVRRRSQRIEFVADTSEVPHLRVTIGGAGGRDRVAELAVEWPDGRRSERRLSAGSCEAAVDALALVVVMTLDPEAVREGGEREQEMAGTSTNTNTSTGTSTSTSTSTGTSTSTSTGTSTSTSTSTYTDTDTDSGSDTDSDTDVGGVLGFAHFAAGAEFRLFSGAAPRVMPGGGLYSRLAFNGFGLWAPALALQLAHVWIDGLAEPGGTADFALDVAELDVCPLGVRLAAFAGHACLASAIGRLSASGSDSYAPRGHDELWASLGGALLLSVQLGAHLELQGGLGLDGPLRRYGFAFAPDVFHRVPKLCLQGHFGAGVRFP